MPFMLAHFPSRLLRLILMFGAAIFSGCQRLHPLPPIAAVWYDEERLLYHGMPVRVAFAPRDERLAAEIWEYLEQVDRIFNNYDPTSEVGRLNHLPKPGSFTVSPAMSEAVVKAKEIHNLTAGAFDITIDPVRRLWKAAEKENRLPEPGEMERALAACGSNHVNFTADGTLRFDRPGMSLDFGGIIKGIAVDKIIARLKESGVHSALVQLSGDTAVFGESPRGGAYVMGIQHPQRLEEIWTKVSDPGSGLTLTTSGNYRQPIVIQGREFYHIYNPRTGMPVTPEILSMSVAFPAVGNNGLADGLATAAVVLGPEAAIPLIAKMGGEGLFLVRDGDGIREIKSSGWDRLVME